MNQKEIRKTEKDQLDRQGKSINSFVDDKSSLHKNFNLVLLKTL